MSESKRFEITEYGSDYYIEIIDNGKELDESIDNPSQKLGLVECVDLLNEQQATIDQLNFAIDDLLSHTSCDEIKKENEQLRQMIKGNVFGRYVEGSLADLKFKAIAYDDIVKVEMSYESEPKVIVVCRQGKKENVKSFCQMFIPFGVYYEIKELEDE